MKKRIVRIVFWVILMALFPSSAYTELAMSTVKQTQAIPFTGPYSLLVCQLRNLTGEPLTLPPGARRRFPASRRLQTVCPRGRGGAGRNREEDPKDLQKHHSGPRSRHGGAGGEDAEAADFLLPTRSKVMIRVVSLSG